NMADLATRLPDVQGTRTVRAAFAFLFVGVGIKMALFPLHLWLPNAYTYAPSAVTAFLAGTATKVAVYVLLRIFLTVFGAAYTFEQMAFDRLLLPLAVAGVVSASVVALYQTDCRRLLAYSSVAQIGYMVLGISLATVTGLTAAIVHLFNHALIKAALFMSIGCVLYRIGSAAISDLNGIAREMPLTMAAFVVGGLSLIGVPLTAGFISKWYLIVGALEKDWWWLAAVVLASSLISVFYVWRIVEAAYFRRPTPGVAPRREAPASLLVPTWLLIAANLYFGIDTSLTAGVAGRAAAALLAGSS
ncbi:MAG: monovalent cation/H+ antiporter subunit D family protein, partial [Gammaproteobacteria bacterium]|nr:monovalent cation/H+ antiporter subunit D family protein [Gammaproteobacteria bacterium]